MLTRQKQIRNLILVGIFVFGLFFFVLPAKAEWANHVVISEVQITGGPGKTNNDFIELYNPTEAAINLRGYRLVKRTKTGTSDSLIKSWTEDAFIPAHGFYLWANSDYTDISVTPDVITTASIANDNGIALRFGPNDTGEITDSLGWGNCQNLFIETNTTSTLPVNPGTNQSLERKPGGENGNGEDTNDNYNDFFLQISPNPQNSQSPIKPLIQNPVCGNGVCETGENSDTCPADCSVQPVCGNGIIEEGEECDPGPPENLNGQTCSLLGFTGGNLSCNLNCTFNTSACSSGGGSYSLPSYQIQPGDVVINEIFPEPDSKKGENEWIEIYNKTEHSFDLTSWTIEDNTAKPKSLSGIILPGKSFYLLKKGEHFTFSLNNSGDILILKKGEIMIDQVAYGDFEDGDQLDNAPRPGKSKSIGRDMESSDTNNDKNDFAVCKEISPGEINELEIVAPEDDEKVSQEIQEEMQEEADINYQNFQIYISEFLPSPKGLDAENEWIEIYNAGNEEIDLLGWQLDDIEIGSKPYKFPAGIKIGAESYLLIPRLQSKIALNNDFDSVRLIDPNGRIHYQVDYQKPPEGASYSRNEEGDWFWTKVLTPGAVNNFDEEDEEEEEYLAEESEKLVDQEAYLISLNELKDLEEDSEVMVQGVVIAPPGLFAKTYFYINGAQIYSCKGDFPDLKVGDFIEITGRVSRAFSHKRIKIKSLEDIVVLSNQSKIISQPVSIDELSEELVGHLVEISGELIEKTGTKFYLEDNGQEVEVYIRPKTKIDKKIFKEGQWLKVTGILAESTKSWRILPRWQDDFKIEENFESQQSAIEEPVDGTQELSVIERSTSSIGELWSQILQNKLKYLLISAATLFIILVGLFLKLKGVIK